MDPTDASPAATDVPSAAGAHPHPTAELGRALANVRLLVALVAGTEAVSLSVATRPAIALAISAYAAYAGWLCWTARDGHRPRLPRLAPWIDASWILLYAWLAATPSSLFVLWLLFPVLFASLSSGFASGLRVSLYAIAGASILALRAHPPGALSAELMLQPLSILVLGPLVAALARAGGRMNGRLSVSDRLLDEADPRLGVKRVAEILMRTLTRRFDADLGLLLVWLPDSEPRLFRVDHRGRFSEPSGELRAALLDALVRLPRCVVRGHRGRDLFARLPMRNYPRFHIATRLPTNEARSSVQRLAESIDARSLLAIPVCRRAPHPCRLVLESGKRRYRSRDADVAEVFMEQLASVLENAGLLERLADEAIATERARIGRDLHDSAIQPYLGLKYGIEALARKAGTDNPLHADIHALKDVAIGELHQLRELVTAMRSGACGADDALAPALRRQARRFSELFGIDVSVCCDDLPVRRRLAAAILPMVGEALTNVRRHTGATCAEIVVGAQADCYVLRITNAHDRDKPPPPFVPRSIAERAESLHGRALVERRRPGFTDLIIRIPKSS